VPAPVDELDPAPGEPQASDPVGGDATPPLGEVPPPVWGRVDWWVCLGLVVVSIVLTGLHVRSYETLSPIDELQHIDYVIRAGELDIPRRNERVSFEAMAEAACRSVDSPGYVSPPCGLDAYDPEEFQEKGFNTAASQFPPYYVITGVGARALTAIGVFDSKVTAARMLGALWAAAAWAVTWYLMALLRIPRRDRIIVLAMLVTTPLAIFHGAATVNADVSLMLGGALAALATIRYETGGMRWWWLVPIFVGLYFVEATMILAIAACAAYLAARRAFDTGRPWHDRLTPLLVFPALALLRLEISGRVHEALFPAVPRTKRSDRLSSAPMFANHRTDGVAWEKVLAQLESTFTPVHNPYFSPPLRSQITIAITQLTNWTLIGLLFAAAFIAVHGVQRIWWARITIAVLLLAGPFYTFYFAYMSNADFAAPARFALPLVPIMAVAAAAGIRTRPARIAVGAVAAVSAANTLFQLVTA
jgi:hypothetical protein